MNRTGGALIAAVVVAVGGVGLVATTDGDSPDPQTSATPTASPPAENPPDAPLVTTSPENPPNAVKKALVIWVENHSLTQMRRDMPYVRGLGDTYAWADDSYGSVHPSQGNYIIAASGVKRVSDNNFHALSGPSIFGMTIANGKKAKTTAQGMGTNCRISSRGAYRGNDHNPWTSFKDETALCRKYDKDYSTWKGIVEKGWLGNVHFLIPDDDHNGHDRSLKVADAFIKSALAPVFAGPDWKSGNLMIIVTADEDDKSSGQHILTVVVHPSQKGRGKVDTPRLDQYSLHETLARVANVTPLGTRWKTNPDFANAFDLPVWKDPEVVAP